MIFDQDRLDETRGPAAVSRDLSHCRSLTRVRYRSSENVQVVPADGQRCRLSSDLSSFHAIGLSPSMGGSKLIGPYWVDLAMIVNDTVYRPKGPPGKIASGQIRSATSLSSPGDPGS